MNVSLTSRPSEKWDECASLVQDVYRERYGAIVEPSPDCFIVVGERGKGEAGADAPANCGDMEVWACAGVSFASTKPFFSERYLDASLEAEVESAFHGPLDRRRAIEVGPLASRVPRAGLETIRVTPILAWCMGAEYILCTATPQLRVAFDKLGIAFTPFGAARIEALPTSQHAAWGTYYDQEPQVGVIPLSRVSKLFAESTGRYRIIAGVEGIAGGTAIDREGFSYETR